jgi:glucuronoarabinoxylan endo-1,4-beta-xylanase
MHARSKCVTALLLLSTILAAGPQAWAVDVTVNASRHYQTIEGFGTCLMAWSAPFRKLYRTEDFQSIYVRSLGCNMLRVNMWGPTFEKPTQDWTQIRYEDFDMSVDGGRPQIFIDFGKGIRKLDPAVKIIGTVWSPPAWMKLNKSAGGKRSGAIRADNYGDIDNRVDPKYFRHFCKWMVEYVRLHERQGAPFYAVSPGNEVQFTQAFESCVWDAKDYATIVTMLREMLDAAGYRQVKIFGPETMTSHLYEGGTLSYIKALKADPNALAALGAFATHGFENDVLPATSATSSRLFWDLIADTGKPFWITEGATGGHAWPAPIRRGIGNALHNALVAGNCSAFVPWQITESRESINSVMVMNRLTPKTYTMMHYSRFIRPGAVRIDAQPAFGDLQVSAFLHEGSGALTIVAINSTSRQQALNLTFENLNGLSALRAYRTSATENLRSVGDVAVNDGKAAFPMMPLSIVTLSGTITGTALSSETKSMMPDGRGHTPG